MTSAEDEKELTLIDHLVELRDRIMKSLIAVVVLFLALFYFANDIYTYVAAPMIAALPEGSTMIAVDPTSPFFAPFKLTFYVSIMIAMPYILYQMWSFIAPGLYKNEKKLAIPLFISSVMLFYSGIAFARYVLFGIVFGFFISVAPEGIQVGPDISSFLSFALTIFLAFGLASKSHRGVACDLGRARGPEALTEHVLCIVGCSCGLLLTPPTLHPVLLAIPCGRCLKSAIHLPARWRANASGKESREEAAS